MAGEILVRVTDPGADDETLERLAASLRRELTELDVDDVRPVPAGPPPDGARAVDAAAVGVLLVAVAQALESIGGIITVVRGWVGGAPADRAVELTIGEHTVKLTSATVDQQDRLVEEFLRAVTRGAPAGGSAQDAGSPA